MFIRFLAFLSLLPLLVTGSAWGTKSPINMSSKKVKLVYFDAKGVAELARIMLHIGGVEFEDHRFSIKTKEGGGFETPEFTKAKESGDLAANMDRAPLLIVDDLKIGQSKAIERYIANVCGMMGSTPEDTAMIDCIAEHTRDIKDKWGKIRAIGGMGPNAEKDAAMKKWFEEGELKEWLARLEKSLPPAAKETGHCVGNDFTYADMSIWYLLRDYFDNKTGVETCAKDCHVLNNIADKVAALEPLKKWLETRPKTMF